MTKTKPTGISRTRLAKETGVGVETIRYYERRKLIDSPSKPEHAHPQYPAQVVDQIRFIRRAQKAGFSLKEIATLDSLGTDHCTVTRALALEKLSKIKQQIAELEDSVELLRKLVDQCDANAEQGKCALFESLQDNQS